jgi:hypothetical protein
LLDIKEALGIPTARINSLTRVYHALDQMRDDSEYSSYAKADLFSNFEEALNKPAIRKWLEWDDQTRRIHNDERRHLLYDWFIGIEEDGERLDPKIVDAKDIRKLPQVIENAKSWAKFVEDPKLKLRDIPTGDQGPTVDWRSVLEGNLETLRKVPGYDLGQATDEDVSLLQDVRAVCDQLISQVEAIRGAKQP